MFKKILIFGLCMVSTALAMENTLENEETESFTIYERAPEDVWQLIANDLPSANAFLNILSRYIHFDDNTYQRIIKAMLYEVEEIPLSSELDTFIDDHYKITKKSEITPSIKNCMLDVIKLHPLFNLSANESDIDRLDKGTYQTTFGLYQGMAKQYNDDGLSSNLIPFQEQQNTNVKELTPQYLSELLNPFKLRSLNDEQLIAYASLVKIARLNVRYMVELLAKVPFNYSRSSVNYYLKNLSAHSGAIIGNMFWHLIFGLPVLAISLTGTFLSHPIAYFCVFLLPAFYIALELNMQNITSEGLITTIKAMLAIVVIGRALIKAVQNVEFEKDDSRYRTLRKKYNLISQQLTDLKKALHYELRRRKMSIPKGTI